MLVKFIFFFFFFSSRRRHTRLTCDWSSDVCSSDLARIVPLRLVVLALVAILLMTSITERSGLDPGVKRFALYFGIWVPYPLIFTIVFAVNLAAYVVGLLVIDIQFQRRMDALGGDLRRRERCAPRVPAIEQPLGRARRPDLGGRVVREVEGVARPGDRKEEEHDVAEIKRDHHGEDRAPRRVAPP